MLAEAARKYINKGWAVVPIPKGEKGPIIKGWPELRIQVPEVDHWFRPDQNIGVIQGAASGGLVCIDLDHPLAVKLGPYFLPPTGLISGREKSPRTHWYYVSPGIESSKFKLPKDPADPERKLTVVEILSDGNQVVVGPSVHPTGDQYYVLDGEPAEIDPQELRGAVESLFKTVCEHYGAVAKSKERNPTAPQGIGSGYPGQDYDERGDVRTLLETHGWARLFVSGENEHWRRPGKTWGTSATLKNGRLFYVFTSSTGLESDTCYGPFGLFSALEHGGDFKAATIALREQGYGEAIQTVNLQYIEATGEDEDEHEEEPVSTVGLFPDECLAPGGLLGEIIFHCLETSRYPQPELALAAALGLVGTITGRKVTDEFGTRTNIYILGLAETGTGKEHARQINKDILLRSGAEKLIGSERVGSHAGIVNAVFESPTLLMQLDEIGRLLATMKDPKKAPHLYNCITVLMQLYSSSGTIWKADAYADSKRVKVINQPHLCVYGTATPDSFWHNLSTENIAEGLVGRLMVFDGRGYDVDMVKPNTTPAPLEIIESIRWWCDYRPEGGNLTNENPIPSVVRHTPEAEARFMRHVGDINSRRRSEGKLRAALWSRSGEKVAKLALVHACSRARLVPGRIEIEDVEFGILLANWLTRRMLAACVEHVSENDVEAKAKRILQLVGSDRMTMSQLSRKTQWLRSRERNEIVNDLFGCGLLSSEQTDSTGGRPKTYIFRPQKTR